jgi:hypothetical protein
MFLLAFGLKDPLFFFKSHGLTNEQRNGITAERENKVRLISGMVEQRKHLEKDVLLKRKVLAEKKKGFQEIIKWKKKIMCQLQQTWKTFLIATTLWQQLTMVVN